MNQKHSVLKLSDIRTDRISRRDFKDILQKQMPPFAYFYSRYEHIAYIALSLIKDIQVRKTGKSVQENAKKVLLEFFKTLPDDNYATLFVINILELYGPLPIEYKQRLEQAAKHDLSKIDDLLLHYHSQKFIEDHKQNNTKSHNHSERTLLEFFNRTVKKRNEILDYITYKLDDRAIEKSRDRRRHSKSKESKKSVYAKYHEEYIKSKDFPYRDSVIDFKKAEYKYVINFELLDYRKINLVINKAFAVNTIKGDDSKGYGKDFWRSVNKINSSEIFTTLLRLVKDLPIVNERHKVFVELRKLFRNRNWYGFYALALPQIEGIFSEMIDASNPKGKRTGALTDKVQQIRPFYDSSHYSFDYYAFHLPDERNKFSHTGKVDDVKKKSKILLLDLLAIVKVFGELNSPLIRVKEVIDKGVKGITDIGKLSNFLHLVNQLNNDKLFSTIEKSCKKFVYQELLLRNDFQSFILNLSTDFNSVYDNYRENIHIFSGADDSPIDLDSIPGVHLQQKIQRLQQVHDNHSFMFEENLKLLLDTYYVINKLTSLFPGCSEETKAIITDFTDRHNQQLKIVKILNEKLTVTLPDDYILMRRHLTHYRGEK